VQGLAEALAELLTVVIGSGAGLPVLAVAVAQNGSMMYVEYDTDGTGGVICTPLADHIESDTFQPPINMMFVDAEGEAYRAVIDNEGARLLH
jgi:hypothetical protein